jgi:histone-lysine N-methyltransferase SUV420H
MKVSEKIVIKVKPNTPNSSSQRRGVVDDQPVKRKRGRPRLSSPRNRSKVQAEPEVVVVKIEEESAEASLRRTFSQPRATNGRFGRKDKPQRRMSESLASVLTKSPKSPKNRTEKRADEPSRGTWTSPRRKRGNDGEIEEIEDDRRLKISRIEPDDLDTPKPHQRVMPRRASGFKGGSLLSNPNPLRFALQAWAGPVVLDDSSSEDDSSAPDTPEDVLSPAPEIVTVEDDELSASALLPAPPALHHAPLIYKPSPFAFSKRRWVALSALPERLASARKQVPKDERQDDDDDDVESCEGDKTEDSSSQSKTASYSSRWTTKSFLVDNDVS